MKVQANKTSSWAMFIAFIVLLSQFAFQPIANAATSGSGLCQQTYTNSAGSESVTVTSGDNYCYVAFKNLGAAGSAGSTYSWTKPSGISSLDLLVIGGGGGGGARHGGGGGAGSFVQATSYAVTSSLTNINVVVGSGGVGATGLSTGVLVGTRGNESSFKIGANGLTALGGGAGINGSTANVNGGSGGGGGAGNTPGNPTRSTQKSLDGSSTLTGIEFGESGAAGVADPNSGISANTDYWAAGGGGGAGGVGKRPTLSGSEYLSATFPDGDGSLTKGGDGGIGKVSSFISSTVATNLGIGQNSSGSVYFTAGGGGGIGADGAAGGLGGIGGGGNGTRAAATGGIAALTSTGSGGGGSGFDDITPVAGDVTNPPGGAGGSGIVVIRYLSALPSVSVSLAVGILNFRTVKAISATPTVAGKLTFRANNQIIPGCKNLSAIANVAKGCSYRPSARGDVSITVTIVPTEAGFASSTTRTATYFVYKRTGSR